MINSLALGYRILGRRFELLLIPVALSLAALFWPPVDISPLTRQLETMLQEAQSTEATGDVAPGLENLLPSFSLDTFPGLDFSALPLGPFLINRMFFRVPGYVRIDPPEALNGGWNLPASDPVEVIFLIGGVFLCGVLAGTLYLFRLSYLVPQAEATSESELDPETLVPTFWFRVGQMLLYFLAMVLAWMISAFLFSLLLILASLVMPAGALAALSALIVMVYFVVTLLFLYYQTYVTASVVMDGLTLWNALRRSVQLVRHSLFSTTLFLILSGFILLGIERLLDSIILLTNESMVSILLSSVVFAYVGTGIALAFLVFYRTRYLRQQGMDIMAYFESQEI